MSLLRYISTAEPCRELDRDPLPSLRMLRFLRFLECSYRTRADLISSARDTGLLGCLDSSAIIALLSACASSGNDFSKVLCRLLCAFERILLLIARLSLDYSSVAESMLDCFTYAIFFFSSSNRFCSRSLWFLSSSSRYCSSTSASSRTTRSF